MKTPITFNNKTFKILISVAASIYITFHGREIRILESLQKPLFYIAITVSFLITYLMVSIVDYTNRWLDKRYDWREETLKRSLSQLVMGISFPLMIDFVIISVYFYFLGTNVFDNGFLRHDFPVIVLFVVVINMHYILVSIFAEKEVLNKIMVYKQLDMANISSDEELQEKPEPDMAVEELISNDDYTLTIRHDGVFARFHIKNEILYFYSEERKIYLVTKLGKEYSFSDKSIAELETELQTFDFCKISRAVLINCDTIRGYSTTSQRDTFRLILKNEYEAILPEKYVAHFLISRRFLARFKNRFEKI